MDAYLASRQVSLKLMNCEGVDGCALIILPSFSMNPETAATCTRSYSHFNQAVFAGLAVRVLILQAMVPACSGGIRNKARQVLSTS